MIDTFFLLLLLLRYMHILGAIALMGGTIFMRFALRPVVVTLPLEEQKSAKEYQVNFKFFQRVEGTFKVAPGTVVKSLQVRVFEIGSITPKLSQSVSLS